MELEPDVSILDDHSLNLYDDSDSTTNELIDANNLPPRYAEFSSHATRNNKTGMM